MEDEPVFIVLTSMDFVRGVIASAMAEDTLDENPMLQNLWAAAEFAETTDDFDAAFNMLMM